MLNHLPTVGHLRISESAEIKFPKGHLTIRVWDFTVIFLEKKNLCSDLVTLGQFLLFPSFVTLGKSLTLSELLFLL